MLANYISRVELPKLKTLSLEPLKLLNHLLLKQILTNIDKIFIYHIYKNIFEKIPKKKFKTS
jgi:hypothetical protein